MESKATSSSVKILISYDEFERLKKIEQEFLDLRKTKNENINQDGIVIF